MNIIFGAAFLILVNSALATDYCRKDICPDPKKTHICCRNPGKWGKPDKCGNNPHLYKITDCDKDFILDLHNKHRNEIASGSVSRFPAAANMKEVTWNNELAQIACYNAITCDFKHDSCRSTDNHKYAGQNLAIVGQTKGYKPFRDAYEDLHTKWFVEHQYCDMNNIRKYHGKPLKPGEQIGHFTQMVSDQVDQVGCCVSMFQRGDMKFVYIVCNYSYSNILNRPIYVEGKPKCKKFSRKYRALCSE
ncbi:hypothetical protein HA402_006434 [Bradysia odoriphaga]|nr:hypothetical protein HA402_006434 [Bradysia odoriphaga]